MGSAEVDCHKEIRDDLGTYLDALRTSERGCSSYRTSSAEFLPY